MTNPIPSSGVPANTPSISLENSLSTGAAAKRCGITGQTIRDYIRTGRIRGYRLGPRNYRIPLSEVNRLLAETTAK
jgi:excisionase family DNA binding protein